MTDAPSWPPVTLRGRRCAWWMSAAPPTAWAALTGAKPSTEAVSAAALTAAYSR